MFPLLCSRVVANESKKLFSLKILNRRYVEYVQGQSPEPRVREYFYYIDHQGMLFLDDARMKNFTSCFKGLQKSWSNLLYLAIGASYKKFLAFFFKRLKRNNTGRYAEDFPYVSLCGIERNFVRCDDLPIVFTKVIQKQNETGKDEDWFGYAHAEELLMVPFEPTKLHMNVESGRVYHPAPERAGGIGLVRSKLAIEFSSLFDFENGEEHSPTHFNWKGKRYPLDTAWCKDKVTPTMR